MGEGGNAERDGALADENTGGVEGLPANVASSGFIVTDRLDADIRSVLQFRRSERDSKAVAGARCDPIGRQVVMIVDKVDREFVVIDLANAGIDADVVGGVSHGYHRTMTADSLKQIARLRGFGGVLVVVNTGLGFHDRDLCWELLHQRRDGVVFAR